MKPVQFAVLAACLCAVSSSFIPDKVIKKFAMKKIAEDCFGDEVLEDLKKEMYAAHVKCSGHHTEEMPGAADILGGGPSPLSRRKRDAPRHFSIHKLDKLRARMSAFVGNATCTLRELKMLDSENNVDLVSMKERLAKMEIDDELKSDLSEKMDQCHQFTSCVPESVLVNPVALMGFARQMTFFKCFKDAKLEACMKKTFREDYLPMLAEKNLPDEDDSFYTVLFSAIISEKGH